MQDQYVGFICFLLFICVPVASIIFYVFGYNSGAVDFKQQEKTKYTIYCVNTTDKTFEECEKTFEKRYDDKEIVNEKR